MSATLRCSERNVQTHLCHITGEVGNTWHWALGLLTRWFCSEYKLTTEDWIQNKFKISTCAALCCNYTHWPPTTGHIFCDHWWIVSCISSCCRSWRLQVFFSIVPCLVYVERFAFSCSPHKEKLWFNQLLRYYQVIHLRRILLLTCLISFLLVCTVDNISVLGDKCDRSPWVAVLLDLLLSLTVLERNETNAKGVQADEIGFN